MSTERQLQEAVARCVSLAVYYRNAPRSPKARAMMAEEVHAVAGWVKQLGLKGERILPPLEAELLARYGPEEGARIRSEFAKAFVNLRSCAGACTG